MMQRINKWCRSCFQKGSTENIIPTGTFVNNDDKDYSLSVTITEDSITLLQITDTSRSEIMRRYRVEPEAYDVIILNDKSYMWIESAYGYDEIKIRWYNTDSHLACRFDGETFFKNKRI